MRQAAVKPLPVLLFATLALVAGSASAAPGDQPVPPVSAAQKAEDKSRSRTTVLPARGLFNGDQLSEATKAKLSELIVDALGLQVDVALLVPVGPWQIDGAGHTERDLNAARLQALRRFLTDRGIAPKRIYVELRSEARVTEPRLEVQLVGSPGD